jgi:hypothetical protein
VQDPLLRVEGRFTIDRQRAIARDFRDQIHVPVEMLQSGGQLVAERRLADSMRADERSLQRSPT